MPTAAPRPSLKERAYLAIKQLILDESFPPGTFLSERQLSGLLHMSATPVRSALDRLAEQGFVTISPQQGVVVRETAFDEVIDLYDIRIALEAFVVKSLAGHLRAEQAAHLERQLQEQDGAVKSPDFRRFTKLDTEFHLLLAELQGNREIVRAMGHLRDRLHRYAARVLRHSPDRIVASVTEHRAIAAATICGNGEDAARHLREHLESGKRFFLTR